MRAIILAAGLGTRLGPLGSELPKPLLPMVDIPILRYGLALLAGHRFTEAAINLHHLGDRIVEELDGKAPLALTWSREDPILGTGGALKKMGDWLTCGGRNPFLVMNGKLVLDVDLDAVVKAHEKSGALGTLVVRDVPDAAKWGAIDVSTDGRVVQILGADAPPGARRAMFTGVHVVSPELLSLLPDGESCSMRNGYIPALARGADIRALFYDGYFQEHSNPERYLAGNHALVGGDVTLRFAPGPLVGVDPSAEVASSASLVAPYRIGPRARVGAGAVVGPHTVIGHDAQVAAGATVARSVVWPGARASGKLDRAIVTARQILQA